MTADAGELKCRVSGSKDEVEIFEDLKCRNELKNKNACTEGEEIGGSFVIVNGDSDDGMDRDLDKNDAETGNSELKNESSHENGKKLEEKSESWNLVHEESNGDCRDNEKEKEGAVTKAKENKEVVEVDDGKVEEVNEAIIHEEEVVVLDVAKEKQDGQTLAKSDPKVELGLDNEIPEVEVPEFESPEAVSVTAILESDSVAKPVTLILEQYASGDETEVKQDLTVAEKETVGLQEVEERSGLVNVAQKTNKVETGIKQDLVTAVEETQGLTKVKVDIKLEPKQDLGFANKVNEIVDLVNENGCELEEVLASEPQQDIVVSKEQNIIDGEAETKFDSGSAESGIFVNGDDTHVEKMTNVETELEMDHDNVVEEAKDVTVNDSIDVEPTNFGLESECITDPVDETAENIEVKANQELHSIDVTVNDTIDVQATNFGLESECITDPVDVTMNDSIDVESTNFGLESECITDPVDENAENIEVKANQELDSVDEDIENVVVDLSHESHPMAWQSKNSELVLEHKSDSVVEVIKDNVIEVDHKSNPMVEQIKNVEIEVELESDRIVEEVKNVVIESEQESDSIVETENVEVEFEHKSDPIVEEAKHVEVSVPVAEEAKKVVAPDTVVVGTKNAVVKPKDASDPTIQKVEKSELDASAREYVPLNLVLVNTGSERVGTHVKDAINYGNTIETGSEVGSNLVATKLSSKSKCLAPTSEKEQARNKFNTGLIVDEIRVESGSGAEGSKFMVTSIKDEKPTNKYQKEEKSNKHAQSAETVQVPLETHVARKQYIYMIKVPKLDDAELGKKLQHAFSILEEKTKLRDSIGEETREHAAVVNNYSLDYKAELAKEKAARAVFNAKRKEIDNVQALLSRLNNANSIAEIDEKIRTMVHKQQHETMTLKQEKQYIHDITQMKRLKEQLSSKNPAQEQFVETSDQKDEIESRLKNLKKELDSLRVSLVARESSVKSAWNKYMEQDQILRTLREKYNAADADRQETYLNYRKLKSRQLEQNKLHKMYRDDRENAKRYIHLGDTQGVRSHCTKQVETVMDMWNKSPDFRQKYVAYNTYSTQRRLGTADGRQLGPGEKAPTTFRPQYYKNPNNVVPSSSSTQPCGPVLKSEVTKEQSIEPSKPKQEPKSKQTAKAKPRVPTGEEVKEKEKVERENKLKKEEEEKARKEEELMRERAAKEEERMREKAAEEEKLRKEKEAVELKEKLRLEQKLKAKEAEERKRRQAEKAKARAEIKAQKEAELREKKKAKKEKKSGMSDTGSEEGSLATETNQHGSSQDPDTVAAAASSSSAAAAAAKKRSTRIVTKTKQYSKAQPLPLPLRNKNRRKMITTWIYSVLIALSVLALFFAGNYISFSSFNTSPNFDI